ncbi:MAG: 3-hydroxybutyryl-CoA dehydrogenase, partial [Fimbriimonadaceae bacterium]|nr:3-hydroxybutyryl-CoA dehydrogenase [Alphaproteobacteria bacterium]
MYKNPESSDYVVGVIGAGAMGQGIVQVALQGGLNVILHDAREGGAEAGRDAVFGRLNRLVEKGQLEEAGAAAMRTRVTVASGLEDFAPCDAVVEAVFENLDLKQEIFTTLETIVRDDCILASNTSSLLIASVARACKKRGRIAGLHFFNPVPLMRLVEVIRGPETEKEVVETLGLLGKCLGRTPVTVKDAPGFLVNFGGRAYTTEGMRILYEGVAT